MLSKETVVIMIKKTMKQTVCILSLEVSKKNPPLCLVGIRGHVQIAFIKHLAILHDVVIHQH